MNYYIITFTKVHHKITKELRDKILNPNFTEMNVNGQFIKVSNIADILDEDKYYETFPKKRPETIHNQFEDLYGKIGNQQIRKPSLKTRELLLQGMKKYVGNNPEAKKAKKLYNKNLILT